MASQSRRYNNKSGANHSEGSSNASSPASSINLSNTNQGNNNNAPKYGTLVPNRVFVGGISSTTTEEELCQLFKKYGNVKDTKIIVDRAGVSKGYGFVTFESEDEAKLLQRDADNIVLKERRLNIAPAIKKQPFNRSFETPTSPPPIAAPNIYYHNGIPYTYHNGMAFFTPTNTPAVPALPAPPADPNAVFQAYGPQPTAPPTYSPTLMYSCANPGPPMFMPTQYHPYQHLPFDCFQQMTNGGPYIYNGTGTPSTGRSSPVNTSENVPASHLPALPAPPPPAYYPPSYQQAEMCFSAIPQGMYPFYTVNTTQEGYVQYCDVSQTVDPPSSNMSSEVPQQFIQTRQYYNPSHQYNIPPPLPPKRYQNSSKKSNGSNNMVGNGGMNSRGKFRGNNNSGPTIIDKSALVGAGDAPSLLHLSLTPPVTPSLTVNTNSSAQSASTTSMELSTQMKTLTI